MKFKHSNKLFERMAIDCVCPGMSFSEFMTKLKHLDRSWAHGL